MSDTNAFIGLDVHKEQIAVAVAGAGRDGEVRFWGTVPNKPGAVERLVKKLGERHGRVECAYEAGPTGYGLYRQLVAMGISCKVVAPSRTPEEPGDRIKNDRRDALTLARLLRAGELTFVWVPDEVHEAMRDLVRARQAASSDVRKARQRIQSFLLKEGRSYGRKPWGYNHRVWLANQSLAHPAQQVAFQSYLNAQEQAESRRAELDRQIDELLPQWSLAPIVEALQALKGIGRVIAVALVAEVGDFSRFANPRQLMACLGLVPGEHSSGDRVRPRGITKAGNVPLRALLFEAAWCYRTPPKVGSWLWMRLPAVGQVIKDIAWKAQVRLNGRYRRLTGRGKRTQIAVTAVARELLGFVWAIATRVAATMVAPQAGAEGRAQRAPPLARTSPAGSGQGTGSGQRESSGKNKGRASPDPCRQSEAALGRNVMLGFRSPNESLSDRRGIPGVLTSGGRRLMDRGRVLPRTLLVVPTLDGRS